MLFGITIEVRLLQLLKVPFLILVTLLGIIIAVRAHCAKASSPIFVTLLGIAIEEKEQPAKATSPMPFIPSSIVVFLHPAMSVLVAVSMIALQFSRLSYTLLPLSTTIDSRE